MLVLFTHSCPHCGRKVHLNVMHIGRPRKCRQCGKVADATDPHLESLAMQDSMKQHAELATPADPVEKPARMPR